MFGAKSINRSWAKHIYNNMIWPWYDDNPVIMLSSLLQGLVGIRKVACGIRPDDVTFHIWGGKTDRWNGHPARPGSRGELQDKANELTNSEAYEILERLSVIFAEAAELAKNAKDI